MHELALCDAMLKMVRQVVVDEELEGINSITVEVGSLSGVVPKFIEDCWEAVIDGTEFENTAIKVETLNGIAKCLDCGAEFVADLEKLCCPECGGQKLTPLTGREMTIKEIEAY